MITYVDIAHYQSGLRLDGATAVFAKASQGTSFVDGAYLGFQAQAGRLGIPFGAYHWLDTSDAAAQARHSFSVVGRHVPLMVDDEQGSINVAHTLAFVAAYRELGGVVHLEYAPSWLWARSGRPDLRPLAAAGLGLVASHYGEGTDSPAGWSPYGGVTPTVLQYTDSYHFGGQLVDSNAYRGTLDEFQALINGGMDVELSSRLSNGYTVDNALVTLLARTPTNLNAQLSSILTAASNDPTVEATISDAAVATIAERFIAAIHVPTDAEIAKAVNDDEAARLAQ